LAVSTTTIAIRTTNNFMQLPMPKGQRGFKPSPRFHFSHNAGLPPMGKMPANDMPRQPYWDGGVAHEGQYQMYNDSANDGGGGGDLPPAAYTGPTPTSSAPDLSPSQGGPGSYPPAGPPPPDNTNYSQGSIGNGTPPQGIGDLVQPPDLPAVYNDQPMPTWMRFMPPAAQAAYWAVRGVQRLGDMYHNSHLNKGNGGTADVGPLEDVSGNAPRGGNGSYNPFGGLPPGFTQQDQHINNQEGNFGAPNMDWQGFQGPTFHGDSIFGGRGSPIVPGSGFLNNESSLPTLAGGHSDLGADIALHSGRFRDAIANAPYLNPNFSMGMPKGMAGGQGIGGGGLPMKQNFSDGGVAQDDDIVKSQRSVGAGTDDPRVIPNAPYKINDIEQQFLGQQDEGMRLRDQLNDRDEAEKELEAETAAQATPATDEQRKGVFGTVGVNIDGKETEVPLWNEGMTPAEAEDAARMRMEWGLDVFAPDSELEKAQNAAHKGPDDYVPDDLLNRTNVSPQAMADLYAARNKSQPSKPQPVGFHGGGMARMGKSYAMGGDVSQVSPMQQLQGMGTDTVPAALTPGELILNKQQQAAVMPRPGMKSKLKPEQRAAIEIALRKAHQPKPTI
jgi:hypothetical protein